MKHRRFPGRALRSIGLCSLLALSATAWAGPLDVFSDWFSDAESRIDHWLQNPATRARMSDWDYLQLIPREPGEAGEPNRQPVQLRREAVAAALATVKVVAGKDTVPLFTAEEVDRLGRAIAGALAKATPEQDLVFVSTSRHPVLAAYAPKLTNAGRVFYADGALQLIVGAQLSDAVLGLRPGMTPTRSLEPGRRAKAAALVQLAADQAATATIRRADWIALRLAPADAAEGAARVAPSVSPVAASPVPARPDTPPAAPAKAAEPSPAIDPGVQRHFSEQESRLLLLKQMRDKGLISEAEYQHKRAEVLKAL